MQAHQGKFGVSTHGPTTTTARVFEQEVTGVINANDYTVSGDASKYKYNRNNIERLELSGSGDNDFKDMAIVTSSLFDNAFVSHMIPRLDNQTRWITASLN